MASFVKTRNFFSRMGRFVALLGNTTRTLAALVSLLAFVGIGTSLAAYFTKSFWFIVPGLFIFLVSVSFLIALYTTLESPAAAEADENKSIVSIPAPPPPPASVIRSVRILSKQIEYRYYEEDPKKIQQIKRFKIRSLRDGVASFPDRYSWTGRGKCSIRSLTPGFLITDEGKSEIWDTYSIRFPHSLHTGNEIEFAIAWDLYDEEGRSLPFLSTPIDHETDELLLRVILPPSLQPETAYGYAFENYIDTLPVAVEQLAWDSVSGAIEYKIKDPKLFYKYLVRWYPRNP